MRRDALLWQQAKASVAEQGRAGDLTHTWTTFLRMRKSGDFRDSIRTQEIPHVPEHALAAAHGRGGEGSRGGNVVRHTASGHAVYGPSIGARTRKTSMPVDVLRQAAARTKARAEERHRAMSEAEREFAEGPNTVRRPYRTLHEEVYGEPLGKARRVKAGPGQGAFDFGAAPAAGKQIGRTRSGRTVYDQHDHPEHAGFGPNDHWDAAMLHRAASGRVFDEASDRLAATEEYKRRGRVTHQDIVDNLTDAERAQVVHHNAQETAHITRRSHMPPTPAAKPATQEPAAKTDSSLWTVRQRFGVAGGPDEIALTDEGNARAFSVGAQVKRGKAAEALEALESAGGQGALSERHGARITPTDLGKFDQVAWGHLRSLGYVESLYDGEDGVRLTDAGRQAVKNGRAERERLLARVSAEAPKPAPAAEAKAAAPAAPAVPHPPAGYEPIPHTKLGGWRKREGRGYRYWYPEVAARGGGSHGGHGQRHHKAHAEYHRAEKQSARMRRDGRGFMRHDAAEEAHLAALAAHNRSGVALDGLKESRSNDADAMTRAIGEGADVRIGHDPEPETHAAAYRAALEAKMTGEHYDTFAKVPGKAKLNDAGRLLAAQQAVPSLDLDQAKSLHALGLKWDNRHGEDEGTHSLPEDIAAGDEEKRRGIAALYGKGYVSLEGYRSLGKPPHGGPDPEIVDRRTRVAITPRGLAAFARMKVAMREADQVARGKATAEPKKAQEPQKTVLSAMPKGTKVHGYDKIGRWGDAPAIVDAEEDFDPSLRARRVLVRMALNADGKPWSEARDGALPPVGEMFHQDGRADYKDAVWTVKPGIGVDGSLGRKWQGRWGARQEHWVRVATKDLRQKDIYAIHKHLGEQGFQDVSRERGNIGNLLQKQWLQIFAQPDWDAVQALPYELANAADNLVQVYRRRGAGDTSTPDAEVWAKIPGIYHSGAKLDALKFEVRRGAAKEEKMAKSSSGGKAPPGYELIPHGKHGGYRKRTGDHWTYWYPGKGDTGLRADAMRIHHAGMARYHKDMEGLHGGDNAGAEHWRAAIRHGEAKEYYEKWRDRGPVMGEAQRLTDDADDMTRRADRASEETPHGGVPLRIQDGVFRQTFEGKLPGFPQYKLQEGVHYVLDPQHGPVLTQQGYRHALAQALPHPGVHERQRELLAQIGTYHDDPQERRREWSAERLRSAHDAQEGDGGLALMLSGLKALGYVDTAQPEVHKLPTVSLTPKGLEAWGAMKTAVGAAKTVARERASTAKKSQSATGRIGSCTYYSQEADAPTDARMAADVVAGRTVPGSLAPMAKSWPLQGRPAQMQRMAEELKQAHEDQAGHWGSGGLKEWWQDTYVGQANVAVPLWLQQEGLPREQSVPRAACLPRTSAEETLDRIYRAADPRCAVGLRLAAVERPGVKIVAG